MPQCPLDPPVYDCFLSYRSARFDWVETLARNLVSQGLSVFLDRWGLIPGEDFPSQLDGALKASRAGLLVASPDTVDSEWVRNEWNRMLANRNADRGGGAAAPFRIVPLLLGPMPALPFIGNYHGIDFGAATDEPGYRRAFGMLVKARAGEPPGPDPHHEGPLLLPPGLAADPPMAPSELGAIDQALLLLRSPNPVAILAQRYYPLGRIAAVLAQRLGEQYGPERVVQIAPLNDPGTDGKTYFPHLAQQNGAVPGRAHPRRPAVRGRGGGGIGGKDPSVAGYVERLTETMDWLQSSRKSRFVPGFHSVLAL